MISDAIMTRAIVVSASVLSSSIDRAAAALVSKQNVNGSFEGEVVWCPVITAQIVIAKIATGVGVGTESRAEILTYFAVTRLPDGGWGLHPESNSYRFVTVLVYVAARLLGVTDDDPLLIPARKFMATKMDEAWGLPSWGKFWLSLIGVYDRRDLHPVPPEIFLIPKACPFSPHHFYCHTRNIYLVMAYLWGRRAEFDIGPIAKELRHAIFGTDQRGSSGAQRHALAATDAYVRPGYILRALYETTRVAERWRHLVPGAGCLRARALELCRAGILFEQRATNFQGLSPVNAVLNTLALWFDAPGSDVAKRSMAGLETWAWRDESRGLRYAGARSAMWDTAFALQALCAKRLDSSRISSAILCAAQRLRSRQNLFPLESADPMYRDPIDGGWCFGENDHRWPVSDCTAEALFALCTVRHHFSLADTSDTDRLEAAVRFILERQNSDGGFATYERNRGGSFLERLNPSEMFGQCMTERSYVECTGSCLSALAEAATLIHDTTLCDRMASALQRGRHFLLAQQLDDGSWPGFWGINRVYGTLFALWGLRAAGCNGSHAALCRAATWLRSTQRSNGAWGEHFSGCLSRTYVPSRHGRIPSTAWAMLALLVATDGAESCLHRAAVWLIGRQQPDGGWPHDGVNGAFFGTAMLDYRLYNSVFPLWALAEFERRQEKSRD
ncbi:prenyltransferase/squalene oxidase repeat-containing protein [Pseudomonas fluorescens]|uniref:prenyltransferase/squalene oxidase repeat-containing protein n=1 Tax=Pseudomonas fluorescens TaxID=294 RepID=UPI001BE51A5B|nr:prenyltransferase/squalene oxidase repeat-containing protein [Pseudomonas fluorescens]MBT2375344.1 hypothetical protein [Pseudomonas fluorescens]